MARLPNLFYAQSGGMTAVINATAAGVIETAARHKDSIGRVYAGQNGIMGALFEELVDTSKEKPSEIAALRYTPGGVFGSSRFPLGTPQTHPQHYRRILDVFAAHDIRWFVYNGGGGSAGTSLHVSNAAKAAGYPLQVIHLPKTVDNDMLLTDFSPGFGSVAKYTAVSVREAALDVASMCRTSTQVFVMEVMGRHAGWIAAASALAQEDGAGAPHLILLPEVEFDAARFLQRVKETVQREGYCVVVAAEGLAIHNPVLQLPEVSSADEHRFDLLNVHTGKAAPYISDLVSRFLGYRCHYAVSDYLQRSARHIASAVDVDAAWRLGESAVHMALSGADRVMPGLQRVVRRRQVAWDVVAQPLEKVASREKGLPRSFVRKDGFGVTPACLDYLRPLIQGEDYPPYEKGLPRHAVLRLQKVRRKLTDYSV